MIIKSATGLAFAAACLTAIATLATANAQQAYGTDPGGNSVGLPGPNPGGPGLTPYSGGGYGYATGGRYAPQPQYYGPPPAAGTGGAEMVTNGPQTSAGDVSPSSSAQRNVAQSERYDRLLETSPAFRQARIRRECGPITDPQLRQQCLDSFAQYEPSGSATGYGSSTATPGDQSNSGR